MRTTPAYWLGSLLLFLGLLYAFLPHAYHEQIGGPLAEEHSVHTALGVGVTLLGLVVLIGEARRQKAVRDRRSRLRKRRRR